ncbi:MAG: DinB family protein [Dokdonia sp.]|nr:DinB family protein [Dokdonia sp.]
MEYAFDICLKNRQLLDEMLRTLTLEQLNTIPAGFNNNILWNIGHSIVTQQLLVYGLSGNEFQIEQHLIDLYRKGTKPERIMTQEEVAELQGLLFSTLTQLEADYNSGKFKDYKTYTLGTTGGILTTVENAIEFNNFHEGLHLGYSMALMRLVKS